MSYRIHTEEALSMNKNMQRVPWKLLLALTGFSSLCAVQAVAADFIYVASGDTVQGYSSTGVAGTLFTPTIAWANAFALTTDSSGNLYVSDASANRIVEFNSTGQQLAVLTIPSDLTGGGISPQEIALSGQDLYVTSFNGNILKFANHTGTGSIVENIPGARGILINGQTTYVTASGLGSASGVYSFTTGGGGSITALADTTTAYPGGQLRGLARDSAGSLYVADSSWGGAGYIDISLNGGTSWSNFALNNTDQAAGGPNDIAIANASATPTSSSGQSLYIADYFTGIVEEYQDNTANGSHSGNFVKNLVTISGHNITGIAFASGAGNTASLSDQPVFFSDLATVQQTPEPGTWALLLGAVLLASAIRGSRRRKASIN
jgi:sugar lactone lactonase YvrE